MMEKEPRCPRCHGLLVTDELAEWIAANCSYDGGEFSGGHDHGLCECPPETEVMDHD